MKRRGGPPRRAEVKQRRESVIGSRSAVPLTEPAMVAPPPVMVAVYWTAAAMAGVRRRVGGADPQGRAGAAGRAFSADQGRGR